MAGAVALKRKRLSGSTVDHAHPDACPVLQVEHTTPTKPGKKMVEEQRWSFARHMEHSVLNEPAAEADTVGGSTFTPQFGTAGNPSQFRSSAVEGEHA